MGFEGPSRQLEVDEANTASEPPRCCNGRWMQKVMMFIIRLPDGPRREGSF